VDQTPFELHPAAVFGHLQLWKTCILCRKLSVETFLLGYARRRRARAAEYSVPTKPLKYLVEGFQEYRNATMKLGGLRCKYLPTSISNKMPT
jgi:hypothetical protein